MKWWKNLKKWLQRKLGKAQEQSNSFPDNSRKKQEEIPEKKRYFPCNAYFRSIVGEILSQKNISYRDMQLLVIDTEPGAYLCREEEQYMVRQLYQGLNAFSLYTSQPEYHAEEIDYLYEEFGLIVETLDKDSRYDKKDDKCSKGKLILDFEEKGRIREEFLSEKSIYISIYKRDWYQRANLDIEVPIGYNTMIVKGTGFAGSKAVSDRLEREFYAE